MKASVFPGSSGEPLFLNLILCKRRVKLSFSDYGFNWWTWCICEEICKKRSVRFPDTPLSVLRGDLALADPVETAELLQVSGGTDQHDLGESSGAEVPKARHLLTCADAGVDHGRLGLPVVGACLPLFPENIPHPSSSLRSGLLKKLLDGGHRPGLLLLRGDRRGQVPLLGAVVAELGVVAAPRSPRRSPYSQCGPPRSG